MIICIFLDWILFCPVQFYNNGCVSTWPFLQLNRRRVLPLLLPLLLGPSLRWRTDLTQIPIAADSRSLSVFLLFLLFLLFFVPFRSLTVFLTFLIHRQKRDVCDSFISRMALEFSSGTPEDGYEHGYKSYDTCP